MYLMTKPVLELTLTKPGHEIVYRGTRSRTMKKVTIDREWDVTLDGVSIGRVIYRMATHERRIGQRTYVEARWQVPAWFAQSGERYSHQFERWSKKSAVDWLIEQHNRENS